MARRGTAARAEPFLDPGETVVGTATVWVAGIGRAPLWLTGRHRHALVLTERRILLFERRRRSDRPALDVRLGDLALERVRRALWFTQVLVRADAIGGTRRLLLEFRVRDRSTGVAFVDALRTTAHT
jgi:hypothetical protein